MTDSIRRAMWHLVLLAMLPAAIGPGAGRCQGLADVQPRPHRLAVQPGRDGDRPGQRRPARGEMAVPGQGSDQQIGVIHATPTVVDGYVYFGTATDPTFYKLSPDGKLCWVVSQADPRRAEPPAVASAGAGRGAGARLPLPVVRRGDHDLGPGDRGHRLLRRRRRLVLRPRSRRPARSAGRSTRGPSDFPGAHADQRLLRLADPRRRQDHRRRRRARAAPARAGSFYRGSTGRGFLTGPRAEDRPDRLEVRPRPQARAARPADHDQG